MLRSKRGPALFDYIDSGDTEGGSVRLPRWWRRPAVEKAATPTAQKPLPPVDIPDRPVAALPSPVEAKMPCRAARAWVEIDDDRIRVSFSSVTAAGAVFLLIMLLVTAFEFGRRRGETAGVVRGFEEGKASLASVEGDELETVRQQAPATDVVKSLVRDPSKESGGNPASSSQAKPVEGPPKKAGQERWIKGRTYIVVQEFSAGNDEHVRQAQGFLASRSFSTAIVRTATGAVRLITTEGFDRQDPAERRVSEQFLARVHAAGEDYYRDGGGYKLQGYFATLKGDTW